MARKKADRSGDGTPGADNPPVPFRLTKAARTIPFAWRHGLTEETAYEWFRSIRFRDNRGEPFCPACGSLKCYTIASRPRWWSCGDSACRKQFSITSGTIFHSRKLEFVRLAELVFRFAECAKGTSACELGISFQASYVTIFVNLMKMREAMSSRREGVWLEGEVEMDAAWFGGKVRKRNKASDRKNIDLRKAEYQRGKRALFVARQRDGSSVMFAADGETSDVAMAAVRQVVRLGDKTKVLTDQGPAYGDIGVYADHLTVDHGVGYSVDGINTNQAESSFSRARRAELGVYHHWSPVWLDFYGGEMCWREDRRRLGNLEQAVDIVALAFSHPQSRNLKGYWQHWELPEEQRQRGEVRFARVHANVRPKGNKQEAKAPPKADARPDAGPVLVRAAEPFKGRRIPPKD